MAEQTAEKLREILEAYRSRMKSGGHPKELPEQILTLARDFPGERQMPENLEPLYAAAQRYWNAHDQMNDPDPLDLEMVLDEVIDALYEFYGLR